MRFLKLLKWIFIFCGGLYLLAVGTGSAGLAGMLVKLGATKGTGGLVLLTILLFIALDTVMDIGALLDFVFGRSRKRR